MHSTVAHLQTDVLVLGAGLAGLRAAWSAAQSEPDMRVVLAAPRARPSGSSFANRNNALGLQCPRTTAERESLLGRIMALAGDSDLRPSLAGLVVDEASRRIDDLASIGVPFRRTDAGGMVRVSGCFDSNPTGVILTPLARAHRAIMERLDTLEVEYAAGCEAVRLVVLDGRCAGAVLRCTLTGALTTVAAGAVVAACGGPAPLFRDHMAGPGNRGLSWGLLREVGAEMVNTRNMQFMWTTEPDGQFTSPSRLLKADTVLFTDDGVQHLPQELRDRLPALLSSRSTHCPAAHTLADGETDRHLARLRFSDGLVRGRTGATDWTIRLRAHGANGGALVNEHGETSVPGLLAAGECAGGMHGADRVGGAMATGTQVFGHRAGMRAMRLATSAPLVDQRDMVNACGELGLHHEALDRDLLSRIRHSLSDHAVLGGMDGVGRFRRELHEMLERSDARSTQLAALTALCITGS